MSSTSPPVVFFTIVARNYIAYARTVCQSIARHHPEAVIFIGLSDRDEGSEIKNVDDPFEVVNVGQLGLPEAECFAFRYDVMEFSTAIKPYIFRWLFQNTGAPAIIYLDPDILVLSPLTKVLALLEQGASAVLTPHLTEPVDDGFNPGEITMLRVGAYNLGFIAINRGREGLRLVDWWCDRLERGAVVNLEQGLFTDQKWADLMPGLFDDVAILRSPGYNVAYWNLMHRKVSCRNETWLVNEEPISFFHFSGIDPRQPEQFSKHQNRYTLNSLGSLRLLYEQYLGLLKDNAYFEAVNTPYGYGTLLDGTHIHRAMREYFRRQLDHVGSTLDAPFEILSTVYFNDLEDSLPGNTLVSRFMYGLHLSDTSIQQAYKLTCYQDYVNYTNWFVMAATMLYKVDEVFIAAARERIEQIPDIGMLGASEWLKRWLGRKALNAYHWNPQLAARVVRLIPEQWLNALKSYAVHPAAPLLPSHFQLERFFARVRALWSHVGFWSNPVTEGDKANTADSGVARMAQNWSETGVSLVGYVRGDFGVAQNLRQVANTLLNAGYPLDILEVSTDGHYSEKDASLNDHVVAESTKPIQLFCVNADQMNNVISKGMLDTQPRAYRIGYWFWELANFPAEWMHAFDYVDEVWAPSRFIYDTLAAVSPKPVIYMPMAVEFQVDGRHTRADFHLEEHSFLFLFSYDFNSYSQRKNPEAVIAAFLEAFPKGRAGVGLVIKTIHGERHPGTYIKLLELAQEDPRIRVVNAALDRDAMYGLINVCDCYVSLHRSEGFGLGLAEAMYLGKPVIGTAYSGNLDFMDQNTSCLVAYRMVPVAQDAYPFWSGQEWAEPDVMQAAEQMRKLFEDKEFRTRIATAGREHIIRAHSMSRVGKQLELRFKAIEDQARMG